MKRAIASVVALIVVLLPTAPANGEWIAFFGEVKHYRRGDALNIYAGAYFPRWVCKKKIRFRLTDSSGEKFGMKSLETEAEGLVTSRHGSTYVGDVPGGAALGPAKLRGRQDCGNIVGTATDTIGLYILGGDGKPEVTAATARDVVGGDRTQLKLRFSMNKWSRAWLSVTIEYEVAPDVWTKVDTVTTTALLTDGGTYTIPWRARLDSAAPGGRYRFHATFTRTEFEGGTVEEGFAEFSVAKPLPDADGPLDGAISPTGQLVVGDVGQNALLVYNDADRSVDAWGAGVLNEPKDLDFGPDGKIYVADYGNKRIAVLSSTGQFVDQYGENAFTGRRGPDGIAVDAASNRIYVADEDSRVVWIFPLDQDTQTPQKIDIPEFDSPEDVDVAADGSLYVADDTAQKVFHVSATGTLLGVLGADFGGPTRSVSVAPDGRIYVVAGQYVATPTGHYEHEVWVFGADGSVLARTGRVLLRDTSGVIAAGAAGDVYVTEKTLGHVYRFRIP